MKRTRCGKRANANRKEELRVQRGIGRAELWFDGDADMKSIDLGDAHVAP